MRVREPGPLSESPPVWPRVREARVRVGVPTDQVEIGVMPKESPLAHVAVGTCGGRDGGAFGSCAGPSAARRACWPCRRLNLDRGAIKAKNKKKFYKLVKKHSIAEAEMMVYYSKRR